MAAPPTDMVTVPKRSSIIDNLPFIMVKIGKNRVIPALLDSGSTLNAISQECFDFLGKKMFKRFEEGLTTEIISVAGNAVALEAQGTIIIKFNTLSWPVTFKILKNVPIYMLLGYSFFLKTGLLLDAENWQISFLNNPLKTYPLLSTNSKAPVDTKTLANTINLTIKL